MSEALPIAFLSLDQLNSNCYLLTMTAYRRFKVSGGAYFFTVNLHDRRRALLVEHIDCLRDAVRGAKARAPFHIDAWVVLPNHLHCLWTLPEDDADFSSRWQVIKAGFSRQLPEGEFISASRKTRAERGIWQRRFWEHTIRDDRDYAAHMDYIHFNPVKHGLVAEAVDWPHSSFHRAVRAGLYPTGWQGRGDMLTETGEAWTRAKRWVALRSPILRCYRAHMDYVHFNPVRHGLVRTAAEWPYSTFVACVRKGLYPPDWVGGPEPAGSFGEKLESGRVPH